MAQTLPLDAPAPYDQLRGMLQRMLAVTQLSELLVAEPDFGRRVRLVTRVAASVGMGMGALLVYEAATEALVPLAIVNGLNPTPMPFSGAQSGLTPLSLIGSLALTEGIAGQVARERAAIFVPDLPADPRWQPAHFAPDAAVLGIAPRSIIALPLLEGERLLGVLEVAQDAQGPGFDARTIDLLHAVAAQAMLILTIEQRNQEVHRERQRAVDGQEDTCRRLARDLHDGPVQSVANAAMTLEYIDTLLDKQPAQARNELRQLYARLTRTMRDLRGVLFDLRPLALESAGLGAALPHLIERLQTDHGPQIHLNCDLPARLSQASETAIYLIVREALTNAIKHAQASECRVELRTLAGSDAPDGCPAVQVSIRDNGVGFDSEAVLAHYPHGQSWGLLNMFERARLVTERFAIRSRPGQGTVVELLVPL